LKRLDVKEYLVLLDVVENGQCIPTDKDEAEIPRSSWNDYQKTRYLLNSKKQNMKKVRNYKSSKEMWDTLTLACKGMLQVNGELDLNRDLPVEPKLSKT
ncbi:hypothetical protein CR513_03374, partial [Mucuna pruriens]